MCFNPVLTSDVNRTCLEFGFHDPKAFFNLPTLLIDPDNLVNITVHVCYNGIKPIISGLIGNLILIKTINTFIGNLTIWRNGRFTNKTSWIIGTFSFSFLLRTGNHLLSPFNLPIMDFSLVRLIFWRISNNQCLVKFPSGHCYLFIINGAERDV